MHRICSAAATVLWMAIWLSGCGRHEPRITTYQEIRVTPPTAQTAQTAHPPATAPSLKWHLPENWSEAPGGGMRLASFSPPAWEGLGQGSVILLGGDAGGLEANLRRWMQQIKLQPPDETAFQAFLAGLAPKTTRGGFPCVLVDFGALLDPAADPSTPSMLAAAVTLQDQTAFFKLTGPADKLAAQRASFEQFCLSVEASP